MDDMAEDCDRVEFGWGKDTEDFEDVLITVRFLMEKNPKIQFWTTYQVRSTDWTVEALLLKWNLRCYNIPLKRFDADKECLAGSNLPGRHSIEMMIITLDTHELVLVHKNVAFCKNGN
ncbi:histone-arginine methyltransferase METTL23 [Hyperolius riggenbachi]|uniref:histone-arginine methyltransferase METTL23 n=1 Tax=Hyperolius riggenbachi TaxID=752182 RepID=UPI0035A34B46